MPNAPLQAVYARHTVGLADPLRDADIPTDEALNDGAQRRSALAACGCRAGRGQGAAHQRRERECELLRVRVLEVIDVNPAASADRDIQSLDQLAHILHLGAGLSAVTRDGNRIAAESGAPLAEVCEFAAEEGLTGLEFASGVPGAVGRLLLQLDVDDEFHGSVTAPASLV